MSWVLFIFISEALNCAPLDYKTQIGPFDSKKSCLYAKALISHDVDNANFYCLKVRETNGL